MSILSDYKKNKKKMDKVLGVGTKTPPKKTAAASKPAPKAKPEVIVKRSKLVKFNKELYVERGTDYEWEMGDERYYLYYGDDEHILGYLPATLNSFIEQHDDGQSLTIDALIDGQIVLVYEEIDG